MFKALLLAMGSLWLFSAQASELIWLGQFDGNSAEIPAPWRTLQLDQNVAATRYQPRFWDGVGAIEASAQHSMTLLARPVTVDLVKTPVLCWRWRVDAVLQHADMASKQGDDYAARVYIAFKLPSAELDWATRAKLAMARMIYGDALPDAAINYVWDNRYPVGTQRANAYTERTQMLVVESGNLKAGGWVNERRDVLHDLQAGFATTNAQLTLLALAVDTDNTGESAHAGFADLHMVSRDHACVRK